MNARLTVIVLAISVLTACSTVMDYYVIDQPVGRTEYYLGNDSDIANTIKEVSKYGVTEQTLKPLNQSDDKLYQLINHAISDAQDKNLDPVMALNNSNIGVSCVEKLCEYQGRIINKVENIHRQVNTSKERYGRILSNTITITFNPYNLQSSYQLLIDTESHEVPFERKFFR